MTTTTHGLTYPEDISRNAQNGAPDAQSLLAPGVHRLSTKQFSDLHLRHILSHPEDNVLFPFLHGLEGQNEAQNQFFAHQGMRQVPKSSSLTATIPHCRHLMWVICEEDLDSPAQLGPLARGAGLARDDSAMASPDSYSSSLYEDEDDDLDMDEDFDDDHIYYSSSESTEDGPTSPIVDMDDVDMNVDIVNSPSSEFGGGFDAHMVARDDDKNQDKHMHPVAHRQTNAVTMGVDSPLTSTTPASPSKKRKSTKQSVPILTSSFREGDIITPSIHTTPQLDGSTKTEQAHVFVPLRVPDGISLRNFGIQVPVVSTLSDFVVYSPKGPTTNAINLAKRLKSAVDRKYQERVLQLGPDSEELVKHNVFVLDATSTEIYHDLPHLVVRMIPGGYVPDAIAMQRQAVDDTTSTFDAMTRARKGPGVPNTVDFAQREQDEMRDLTRASEILTIRPSSEEGNKTEGKGAEGFQPTLGQVFLGNSSDVPFCDDWRRDPIRPTQESTAFSRSPSSTSFSDVSSEDGEGKSRTAAQSLPREHPLNPNPTNLPDHGMGYDICIECHDMAPFPAVSVLRSAEERIDQLEELWSARQTRNGNADLPPRPPPHANAIVHFSMPSSPAPTNANVNSLMAIVKFLETCLNPVGQSTSPPSIPNPVHEEEKKKEGRRWSTLPSIIPTFPIPASSPGPTSMAAARLRSLTSAGSAPSSSPISESFPQTQKRKWSRPLKVLIYSADGYTESSVAALCLLMATKELTLPEAYLELQVAKKRSFFVYQTDLNLLRRFESRTQEERRGHERRLSHRPTSSYSGWKSTSPSPKPAPTSRPSAKSVSFAQAPLINLPPPSHPPPLRPTQTSTFDSVLPPRSSRPRANTMPSGMMGLDHQSWFNDTRFDGSFPSRVLPFLYLGNLAHATNAYMLHALGITHVVSVGECALVPPPEHQAMIHREGSSPDYSFEDCPPSSHSHFVAGKGPGNSGSLWIEERAGRIKVLDIQGVCDDGIDTLEPQLEPACEWIENARKSGGKVLVHCRVGVSRSATVTIAYVMKHLNISLVDAYIIVRSRRLSVLIQPNMRLLYNLCGWEIKLAKERAGDDEDKLRYELSSALSWPFLAKEVHKLNEKYLH